MNPLRSYEQLLGIVAVARLAEIAFQQARSRRARRERGAATRPRGDTVLFVLAQLATLGGPLVERAVRHPPWHPGLVAATLLVLSFAVFLRLWTFSAAGAGWPHDALPKEGGESTAAAPGTVAPHGPYRHIRHPAHVAGMLETISIPLMGSAYASCLVAAGLYALLIHRRVRLEERALALVPAVRDLVMRRPRYIPRLRVIPGGRDPHLAREHGSDPPPERPRTA